MSVVWYTWPIASKIPESAEVCRMKIFYTFGIAVLHRRVATTSEHMAQFQYVWHNIWANVLLKFKTTKLFKHALKVIPEKPINLRKQNHIFEVHTKKQQ